jgi:hypothetical protein
MSNDTTKTAQGAQPAPGENDRRAEKAMGAIQASTDCEFRSEGEAGLQTDITDLLADVRHLCDRYAQDYASLDRRAYTAYQGDLADGPLAQQGPGCSLERLPAEPRWVSETVVSETLNKACEELIAVAALPDAGVRDALNLLVNAALIRLRDPEVTLQQVAREAYTEDLETVLGWIDD